MRSLILALCVSSLAGCADKAVAPLQIPPCDKPQTIQAVGLTGLQAARLWNRDREALRVCGARLEVSQGRAVSLDAPPVVR